MADKQLMSDYLVAKRDKLEIDGEVNLNWDKQNHTFEIEVSLEGANQMAAVLEDQFGELTKGEEIDFYDAVLLYDETKIKGEDYAADYLAVIPFQGKKGIQKAVLDAVFKYLQDVIDDGTSDLLDFLNDDTKTTFQLSWQAAAFEQIKAAELKKDDQTYLAYPRF